MMKKTKTTYTFLIVALAYLLFTDCSKDGVTENAEPQPGKDYIYAPQPYVFDLPDYFPRFNLPGFNPTTEEGIALGRRLYYDKTLSLGGPLQGNACASCHRQKTNFSNNVPGTAVMPHTNLNWNKYFLWNGKVSGYLEDIMKFEVTEFFRADISLFKADTTYQRMCFEAFGTMDIGVTEMTYAMAQWLRTLSSYRSRFDEFYQTGKGFNNLELLGYKLFNTEKGDCFHCHGTPMTSDYTFHNIGLESDPDGVNLGRFNVSGNSADIGKFKTPSLRNVALTAPYMHDGRFPTLEDVIEHYNSGVKQCNTLDPIMTKPGKEHGLQLNPTEKAALVAFLKTFTDSTYLSDPRFSDPFQ